MWFGHEGIRRPFSHYRSGALHHAECDGPHGDLSPVLSTGLPVEASTWTVPGTVNAGGLNNTRFVSDLAVTNPGSVPAQATISFIPANGTTPKQVTLNAGETVVYRNVLDRLWGAQGAGATQVASDAPLLIRARTYNTSLIGHLRRCTPGLRGRPAAPARRHGRQPVDQPVGRRKLRLPHECRGRLPGRGWRLGHRDHLRRGRKCAGPQDYNLDAPGFQQFGVGSFAGAVPLGRAEIVVTSGRAAGYSVVVDNVTGDSSLFTFEDLPAGIPGRPRQRRGPCERQKQHLLPDGRPLLQPGIDRRDGVGRLSRQPEHQLGSR